MPKNGYVKLAQNYFTLLTNKGFKFNKCYLFGSCALGTEKKDSDIDILLVSNFFLFPDEEQLHYLYNTTVDYNNKIHLHYMSLLFFNQINPNFDNNKFILNTKSITNSFVSIYTTPDLPTPQPHSIV